MLRLTENIIKFKPSKAQKQKTGNNGCVSRAKTNKISRVETKNVQKDGNKHTR